MQVLSKNNWQQCPEAQRNFVNDVVYDPSDYGTTQIANYAPATPVALQSQPSTRRSCKVR